MTGPTRSLPAAVAAAVTACPAVAGMHAGPIGTYLPGERVPGVHIGEESAQIVVDLAYPATVADLDTQIRAALRPLIQTPVDIEVADVILPGASEPETSIPAVPASSGVPL